MFAANKSSVVQLFYWLREQSATVYVLDEHGALVVDELDGVMESTLLSHFGQFFEAVALRQNAASGTSTDGLELPSELGDSVAESRLHASACVQYNKVSVDQGGRCRVVPMADPNRKSAAFFNVQVIGERVGGKTVFTIYCNGREFSTREYGKRLFAEVAEHVLSQRKGGQLYPIHITDIDLGAVVDGSAPRGGLRTVHYLQYKKKIEQRLNWCLVKRTREYENSSAGESCER